MSTYSEAINFINNSTKDDLPNFYDKIREILRNDLQNYPEDYQIKDLQRKAEEKYQLLLVGKIVKQFTEEEAVEKYGITPDDFFTSQFYSLTENGFLINDWNRIVYPRRRIR